MTVTLVFTYTCHADLSKSFNNLRNKEDILLKYESSIKMKLINKIIIIFIVIVIIITNQSDTSLIIMQTFFFFFLKWRQKDNKNK